MMRAKADPKAASNTILILACLLLAGAVVGLLVRKPNAAKSVATVMAEMKKQQSVAQQAKTDERAARSAVASRTWTGEDAAVTSAILDLTTTLARKRGVSFVRLTPQRTTLGGPLEQLPYLVVVEGAFPNIAALEKDLEVPANRLAVNSFQIASSDSETNKVSASIAVVAQRVGTDVETKEAKNGKGS